MVLIAGARGDDPGGEFEAGSAEKRDVFLLRKDFFFVNRLPEANAKAVGNKSVGSRDPWLQMHATVQIASATVTTCRSCRFLENIVFVFCRGFCIDMMAQAVFDTLLVVAIIHRSRK